MNFEDQKPRSGEFFMRNFLSQLRMEKTLLHARIGKYSLKTTKSDEQKSFILWFLRARNINKILSSAALSMFF